MFGQTWTTGSAAPSNWGKHAYHLVTAYLFPLQHIVSLVLFFYRKQQQREEPLPCKNGMSYQCAVFSLFPQITYGFVLGWSHQGEDK